MLVYYSWGLSDQPLSLVALVHHNMAAIMDLLKHILSPAPLNPLEQLSLLTLSGAVKSSTAVPSAKNSGLERISKWTEESPLVRRTYKRHVPVQLHVLRFAYMPRDCMADLADGFCCLYRHC